jgi:hypothetical protein
MLAACTAARKHEHSETNETICFTTQLRFRNCSWLSTTRMQHCAPVLVQVSQLSCCLHCSPKCRVLDFLLQDRILLTETYHKQNLTFKYIKHHCESMPCASWCNGAVVRHIVVLIRRGGRGQAVHGSIVTGNVNAGKCCNIRDTDIPRQPWKNPLRNHNTELKHLQKMNRNAQDQ